MPLSNINQLITKLNTKESQSCPCPTGILKVNLRQLERNILELTRFANKKKKEKVKFLLPVKANAYGHGIIPVANFVEAKKLCDYFGVANFQEAYELRKNKITTPILILGQPSCEIKYFKFIIKNNIEQTISDENILFTLNQEAKNLDKKANIHLSIDTGMGREGVLLKDFPNILEKILNYSHINLVGVMTHFAVADEKKSTAKIFTNQQINIFKDIKNIINLNLSGKNIIFHTANSAGINFDSNLFDMIRPGIASYGYPEDNSKLKLKPILELKSKICLIKKYPKNYSLGYGQTYKTKKENEIIGIVPIGYGDGLNRLLSNKLTPIINNIKRKSVGRISMDQFSVIIDNKIKVNDEVIILGEQNKISNTAIDLARQSDSISYEILCNLGNSKRLRHEYEY